jgi:hypothetical protein
MTLSQAGATVFYRNEQSAPKLLYGVEGSFDVHGLRGGERGVNATVLRVALALSLAFEAYRLVGFVFRAETPLGVLIGLGVCALPAMGLAAACVLIFLAPRGRRVWYLVVGRGAWLMIFDVIFDYLYLWYALGRSYPWRPSVEFAVGLYAALLALAFLLGRQPSRPARVAAPVNGRAGA